ncbi:hypothetical protein XI07_09620 [Bradyrhizobium sp. CCBAU 11445]|nr:hypothetical protein [Bradyrhizobium sp. CCBAU 11445]MDA9522767.1 hypothetical protein [Bradyrhizobium sp. CCBAU 11434]
MRPGRWSLGRTRLRRTLLRRAELQLVQLLLETSLICRLGIGLLPRTLQLMLLGVPAHPIVRIVITRLDTTLSR